MALTNEPYKCIDPTEEEFQSYIENINGIVAEAYIKDHDIISIPLGLFLSVMVYSARTGNIEKFNKMLDVLEELEKEINGEVNNNCDKE